MYITLSGWRCAKRRTLCSVASTPAIVFSDRPFTRSSVISSATSSTVIARSSLWPMAGNRCLFRW